MHVNSDGERGILVIDGDLHMERVETHLFLFYFIFIEFTAVDFLGKYYVVSNCKCGEESSQIHGKDKYTETLIQKLSSWRWRVAYLTLFGMIAQIIHRNCISFALVCMTTDVRENTSVAHSHEERDELSKYRISQNVLRDSTTQSLVLSAYFYGQLVSPFISGQVSLRFGVRRPMALYMMLSTLLLMITPAVVRVSSYWLIAIRALQGFLGSGCLPMYSQLWNEWAPKSERSQLLAFTFSGLDLGILIVFASSGHLCEIPIDDGWPFIFYTNGGVTLVWLVMWLVFMTDSPVSHRWISIQESNYIRGDDIDNLRKKSLDDQNKMRTPWLLILKSGPVWAMVTAMVTVAYGMTVVFSYLPKYMNDVYKLNTSENGMMSALPFLGRSMSIISIGVLSDKILARRGISVTTLRKINQCLSSCLAALSIFLVQYVQQSELAILLITISTTALGGTMSGSYTNALELAPRFASSLSGLAFTINALGQITAPMITSLMTQEDTNDSWHNVFLSLACVYLFGGVIYAFFGSSEELSWYSRIVNNRRCNSHDIPNISSTIFSNNNTETGSFLKPLSQINLLHYTQKIDEGTVHF
ncbi:uncharacterized transporter slc-17.2-like [Ostrea edulis]|uniref:uncharacterized transporter slc-17.2-like n=1 Tax=Ostrea edulis TaxID=37623 RepID=UPI0024AEE11E|nr:uncharacterized transporter slc-17.2-like [Ostrea edulis]